ncbi:hypothetical protein OC845_003809 [Tilletia horrida]|nr:hypothetical protein OC845_003809 [Tilletia horrida]
MRASSLWFSLMAISLLGLAVRADAECTSSDAAPVKHHSHKHHHQHHKHHKGHKGHKAAAPESPAAAPATPSSPKEEVPANPATKPLTVPSHGAAEDQKCELSGGMATQYWDCCKVSAAWPFGFNVTAPAQSCEADGNTLSKTTQVLSGCNGGTSWACNKQQPFVDPKNPDVSYAIGARWQGHGTKNFYGACYNVQFKELPGKTLIFQALNTGEDYKPDQIDIQCPGGGDGWGDWCYKQWGKPEAAGDKRFVFIKTVDECVNVPKELQDSCKWRFNWLYGKDYPTATPRTIKSMCRVQCPKILTDRTGIARTDDAAYPAFSA